MRSYSRAHNFIDRSGGSGRCSQPACGRLRMAALACLTLLVVGGSSGCTMFDNVSQNFRYSSVWSDAASKMRHRSMSSKSWHRHKNHFCNEACLSDFCAGYRQGYEDVANGGTGCTPNFPPRDYWGWQYQSAEGQRKVAAWFSGYPHGARAAEEDGVGNWSQIQMSSNLQSQYVTSGMLPNQGHAVYPITEPSKTPPVGGPTPVVAPQTGMQVMPVPTGQTTLMNEQTSAYGQFGMATPIGQ